MSGWQQVAICLNCHEVVTDHVPFGMLFHVHMEICPNCGHPKDRPGSLGRFFTGWRVVTARKVSDGWFKGSHWEFLEDLEHADQPAGHVDDADVIAKLAESGREADRL